MAPTTEADDQAEKYLLNSTLSQFHIDTKDQPYDKLVVGAAVFRPSPQPNTPEPQILLLQRSDTEPYYPSVYELPSGKVGKTETVRNALLRELEEESGLVGVSVLEKVKDLEYETVKTVKTAGDNGEAEKDMQVVRRAIQVNYVVKVQDHTQEIVINPEEHQRGGWFTRTELPNLDITDGMKGIIEAAFQWAQQNGHLVV